MIPGQENKRALFIGKILFMEDEELIRKSVSRLLSQLGYEVKLAREGGEAIVLYKNARDASVPFDVVLMDLSIKTGMGGLETIAKLIEMDPRVKAVLASGHVNDPVTLNYKEYGFSEVIAKPFEIEQLHELLVRLTQKPS